MAQTQEKPRSFLRKLGSKLLPTSSSSSVSGASSGNNRSASATSVSTSSLAVPSPTKSTKSRSSNSFSESSTDSSPLASLVATTLPVTTLSPTTVASNNGRRPTPHTLTTRPPSPLRGGGRASPSPSTDNVGDTQQQQQQQQQQQGGSSSSSSSSAAYPRSASGASEAGQPGSEQPCMLSAVFTRVRSLPALGCTDEGSNSSSASASPTDKTPPSAVAGGPAVPGAAAASQAKAAAAGGWKAALRASFPTACAVVQRVMLVVAVALVAYFAYLLLHPIFHSLTSPAHTAHHVTMRDVFRLGQIQRQLALDEEQGSSTSDNLQRELRGILGIQYPVNLTSSKLLFLADLVTTGESWHRVQKKINTLSKAEDLAK